MHGLAASDPGPGAGRRGGGYGGRREGTSGGAEGTGGAGLPGLARAYVAVAVFVFLVDSVNVLSALHEAAWAGRALPVWMPITGEGTSGIGVLIGFGLIYLAIRLATPGQASWQRLALVHVPATIAFSGVHLAVMIGLRVVIYALRRHHYDLPLPADLLYEYRKDVLAYCILAGLFWLFQAPGLRDGLPNAVREPVETRLVEPTFDIIDGARILRTPVGQILAVRAARNYVEFLLEDGRRPLMRASLGNVETALTSRGLVRTHRSWLVNPHRLCRLEATGSGDYRIGLDGDVEAPLSRRFPAALDQLRR